MGQPGLSSASWLASLALDDIPPLVEATWYYENTLENSTVLSMSLHKQKAAVSVASFCCCCKTPAKSTRKVLLPTVVNTWCIDPMQDVWTGVMPDNLGGTRRWMSTIHDNHSKMKQLDGQNCSHAVTLVSQQRGSDKYSTWRKMEVCCFQPQVWSHRATEKPGRMTAIVDSYGDEHIRATRAMTAQVLAYANMVVAGTPKDGRRGGSLLGCQQLQTGLSCAVSHQYWHIATIYTFGAPW